MHLARLTQPRAHRFQHNPLARRHRPQRREFGPRHHPRIGVRQQPGLLQHQPAHGHEVVDGAGIPQCRQPIPRRLVARFRLIPQGKQRLRAARRRPGAGNRQNLLRAQIRRMPFLRPLGEGAVMAHIAAKLGQRNEHLARVGQVAPMPLVARRRCGLQQLGQAGIGNKSQRFVMGRNGGHGRLRKRVQLWWGDIAGCAMHRGE